MDIQELCLEVEAIADRRRVADELEAKVIGNSLPEPWKAQPKGKIERAMGRFIWGNISEAELRARLTAIKAELT